MKFIKAGEYLETMSGGFQPMRGDVYINLDHVEYVFDKHSGPCVSVKFVGENFCRFFSAEDLRGVLSEISAIKP